MASFESYAHGEDSSHESENDQKRNETVLERIRAAKELKHLVGGVVLGARLLSASPGDDESDGVGGMRRRAEPDTIEHVRQGDFSRVERGPRDMTYDEVMAFGGAEREEGDKQYVEHAAEEHEAIKKVILYVVADGKERQVPIHPTELDGGVIELTLDGYVSGVSAMVRDDVRAYLGESTELPLYGTDEKEWREVYKRGYGGYPLINRTAGDITFRDDGEHIFTLRLSQDVFRKIDEIPYSIDASSDNTAVDPTHIMSIGVTKEDMETVPHFDASMHAALEGVQHVASSLGDVDIDSLGVIGVENRRDAFVFCGREHILFFHLGFLQTADTDRMRIVARHEALHHILHKRGYDRIEAVTLQWAALKGANEDEREHVQRSGYFPPDSERQDTTNTFFEFIEEGAFYKETIGGLAGHAEDHVREFVTSFVNSLMGKERIPDHLPAYTPEQQRFIMDEYEETLSSLVERAEVMKGRSDLSAEESSSVERQLMFFEDALEYIRQVQRQLPLSSS